MRRRLLALLLAAAALLSGCVYSRTAGEERSVTVYRLNADRSAGGAALKPEKLVCREGEEPLDLILTGLNARPSDPGLERAFPEEVSLLSLEVDGGLATAEFSAEYLLLEGVEKLLADYALVCTLYSRDEVLRVRLCCAGRTVAEDLSPEDVLLADDGFEACARPVKLFLPDDSGVFLRPVSRGLVPEEGTEPAAELCALLLEELDLFPATVLISVKQREGCCYVNLTQDFCAWEPAGPEEAETLLRAFVNTLCALSGTDSVVLQVNGRSLADYGGYVPVWPMTPDEGRVRFG